MRVAKTIGISFLCPRTIAVKANAALRRNRRKPTDSTVCRFCRSKRSDDPPGDPYHLSVGVHTPARHERMPPPRCRKTPLRHWRTPLSVEDIQVTAIKTGPQPAQPTRNGFRNRTHGLERRHVAALKEVSQVVPNFHIPDYGSRMTSIYIRGLGAASTNR